jgi:hypothetical protein
VTAPRTTAASNCSWGGNGEQRDVNDGASGRRRGGMNDDEGRDDDGDDNDRVFFCFFRVDFVF